MQSKSGTPKIDTPKIDAFSSFGHYEKASIFGEGLYMYLLYVHWNIVFLNLYKVAYKNVATLMEVMEVLEGGNLVNPAAGAESVTWPNSATNPKPADSIAAAYLTIAKARF